MGLTLVLGAANSAKAGEVLDAYGTAARRGALLVVPTATDALHYARELADRGAVLGSVLTFGGLAAEIGRRAGYAERRLSDLQRARVLERVVARCRLDVLRASAAAAGFAAAAGELIAELQRGLVTPERFAGALRLWAAQDVRRASYAREVGRIYVEYTRELHRLGRVDRELFAWRALDALRAAPGTWHVTPGASAPDSVFFYGFDDLTPLERDAVETLARIPGVEVTVSLTYEPGHEALSARAQTVEELRPIAERVLELPAQDRYYASGSREALHHLERRLFVRGDGEAAGIDPGDAVVLLEAGGERAEAELVAEQVLGLLRGGVPAGEIVIVYRTAAPAAARLAPVFSQYGIPLQTGQPVPLGHAPLGRGLLAGARCGLLADQATAADLLAYLRTPGLLEHPEIADRLDADIRCEGLRTAAQARERLGWDLPELGALAAASDPAAELCRLARRLFAAPHRGSAAILNAHQELDASALRALIAAVDELDELGLAPPAAELLALLETLPVPPTTSGAPGHGDQVLLAEPLEVRARRFRAVFVCGLQEGEFPRPPRPEPFLSDERRRELAAASGLVLRPREDALAAERYLFYACVSRATDRVFLAYRSSDEEGNLALPSPFIADVAELLAPNWRARRRTRLLADVVWPAELAPTARERRRAVAAAQAADAGEEPPARRVLGSGALATVRHSRILSAGALETYGSCPVRWLIERELQPRRLEPESEAIARGNLMHDVLERLLRELGEPLTPASIAAARHVLHRLLAELGDAPPAGGARDVAPPGGASDVARAGALRAIEADLRRYLEHEAASGAGWRPLGLEMRFGFADQDDSSLPPLQLTADGDRVLIRGMIDRVDVDDNGHAVVRDYKSGSPRNEWAGGRWESERQLQVALYMLVVRELLGLEPVGGFYQPLRGDDLRARGVYAAEHPVGAAFSGDARAPAEIDVMLAQASAHAVALAASLRSGELEPCPQTCSRDGCSYPAICRSQ